MNHNASDLACLKRLEQYSELNLVPLNIEAGVIKFLYLSLFIITYILFTRLAFNCVAECQFAMS